jgi:hypothetical protein
MRENTGPRDGTVEILTTAQEAINRSRDRIATGRSPVELRAAILGNLAALESLCAWRREHLGRRRGKAGSVELDEEAFDLANPHLAITSLDALLEVNSRLIGALRIAEQLIAADIVRDDVGCLARIRAALADADPVDQIHGANRQLFAELLAVCRAVVEAERDGGVSMADLWSYARDLARAAASKANGSRFALGLELEAWSAEQKLPNPGNANEMLLRPELTDWQRRWLAHFSLAWAAAS